MSIKPRSGWGIDSLIFPKGRLFSGLYGYESSEVEWWPPQLKIQKDAHGVRQHLTNETRWQVPQVGRLPDEQGAISQQLCNNAPPPHSKGKDTAETGGCSGMSQKQYTDTGSCVRSSTILTRSEKRHSPSFF